MEEVISDMSSGGSGDVWQCMVVLMCPHHEQDVEKDLVVIADVRQVGRTCLIEEDRSQGRRRELREGMSMPNSI